MKWIKASDSRRPRDGECIVAIMQGLKQQTGDKIESAEIVQLRNSDRECRTMDHTALYYWPQEQDEWGNIPDYYRTIAFWIPENEFVYPEEMKT